MYLYIYLYICLFVCGFSLSFMSRANMSRASRKKYNKCARERPYVQGLTYETANIKHTHSLDEEIG